MAGGRFKISAEGVGGIAVSLIGVALAALGLPRPVWIVVLVGGVLLLLVAARQEWRERRSSGDGPVPSPQHGLTAVELSRFRHWLPNVGHLQLLVTYHLGNPRPAPAQLVHAQVEGLKAETATATWAEPHITVRDATGHSGPVAVPASGSASVTCEFFLQLDQANGGWSDPGAYEGDVVLIDEFANRVAGGHVVWR